MSTNVTGFRAHRSSQNLDMDLAWQELMAITELQVGTLEHPTKLALLHAQMSKLKKTSDYFMVGYSQSFYSLNEMVAL